MSGIWDEITGRARLETFAEAMERHKANQAGLVANEQETAAMIVAKRELMRRHDARFSDGFIQADEQRLVSIELAKKLGHLPSQEQYPDDLDVE